MVLNQCVNPTFLSQRTNSTYLKQISSNKFQAFYCTDNYCNDCQSGDIVAGECDNWAAGSVTANVVTSFPPYLSFFFHFFFSFLIKKMIK